MVVVVAAVARPSDSPPEALSARASCETPSGSMAGPHALSAATAAAASRTGAAAVTRREACDDRTTMWGVMALPGAKRASWPTPRFRFRLGRGHPREDLRRRAQ